MSNQFDNNGVILIKQEGCFFNVAYNDALILNKYLGYKLYGKNKIKTGFHIGRLRFALEKIDKIGIDYDVIDKNGDIIVSKRFPFGFYEVIDPNIYKTQKNKQSKNAIKNVVTDDIRKKFELYKNVLKGLCNGCNAFTGELIFGIEDELKITCLEIVNYFEKLIESRVQNNTNKTNQNLNHHKSWLKFDDELLLKEYRRGKSIKELRKIFLRSGNAIRARLKRLLNIKK